eukprot:gnl/TRDRNA2_/TRDRNA2_193225_c0_seq1.p1 gnl/TRDRNA2_/TRDRNA2_193225_c0~~gnl/TRDRNA2_/TRDRNA2_193225_c0_seq1.p1  ORF type:complete len:398 (+),score=48.40 gnl/TRDRNA2_/TRDRNA2_193225_c0_seq1:63-1256(+)
MGRVVAFGISCAACCQAVRLRTTNTPFSLGIPGLPWLPVTLEIEMFKCNPRPEATENNAFVQDMAEEWQKLLSSAALVHPVLFDNKSHTQRTDELRSVAVKQNHFGDPLLHTWTVEREWMGYQQLEITSPISLREDESEFAVSASQGLLGGYFGGDTSSLQIHVDAHCLSHTRLAGLLLLWENFHDVLSLAMKARPVSLGYSAKMSEKNPKLLAYLQEGWAKVQLNNRKLKDQNLTGEETAWPHESLDLAFRRFENSTINRQVSRFGPGLRRDGYRMFALNVCHVLNVNCCHDCEKNKTPKFGYVEFRLFNTEFGQASRHAIALAERLVQASCTASIEDLNRLIMLPSSERVPDAERLLQFLGLDREFLSAFSAPNHLRDLCVGGARVESPWADPPK